MAKKNTQNKAAPTKKKYTGKKPPVPVFGKHPFFENPDRVGANGLVIPVFMEGEKLTVGGITFSANALEAIYYFSCDAICVEILKQIKSDLPSHYLEVLTTQKHGKTVLSQEGKLFLEFLKDLKAVPET